MASTSGSNSTIVRFYVHYATIPYQNVLLVGSSVKLGEWDIKKAVKMGMTSDFVWQTEVEFSTSEDTVEYKYVVIDESNNSVFWEGGENRIISLKEHKGPLEFRDTWRAANLPECTFMRTSIFEDIIFHRESKPITTVVASKAPDLTVRFRLQALIAPNHTLYVTGNTPALGDWNLAKAVPLASSSPSQWGVDISMRRADTPFEYKYVILDESRRVIMWEDGNNRQFKRISRPAFSAVSSSNAVSEFSTVVTCNDIFRKHFDWRGAGVAVPVFSLRTTEGLGVGEFLDLKKLVDLTESFGGRLIQILPVNDTSCFLTWRDSYPYSALSVFALHPIYLRIQRLTTDEELLKEIKSKADELNKLPKIDYEAVMAAKNEFIAKIFASQKDTFMKSEDFKAWKKENEQWLLPYVVFCHLRTRFGTTEYTTWPAEYRHLSMDKIAELAQEWESEVAVNYFVQYHLHLQLLEASKYAASKGIGLKGDLPIGVNRYSVDAWLNPELFHLDMSTGAPPDQFSEDGQNWGFPTYDWDRMSKDNYAWWRARLSQMAKYFHCFRIDHVLGFFRIWEIPTSFESGLMGHFNPSQPIHRHDLERAGIWDIDRLTEPYVKMHLLERFFPGDEAKYVASTYFEPYYDRLKFKEAFNTEEKIFKYTESLPTDTDAAKAWKNRLERGLSYLVKNVVLLPSPYSKDDFFPRVNNFKTPSYQELPEWQRTALWKLYVKYYYGESQESFWASIGRARLPVIRAATRMLVCAEDLGMVPKCVEPVLTDLGILGLRIQRMPSDPKQEFGIPQNYGYLTVCTPSSHDTSTIRGWWQEDRHTTQRFYNTVLGREGAAPEHCETWIVEQIIAQHMYSPSMWAIFPIQDLFAIEHTLRVADPREEKINEPSNPKHYWRYRMHVTIESLLEHKEWIAKIKNLVSSSGRAH